MVFIRLQCLLSGFFHTIDIPGCCHHSVQIVPRSLSFSMLWELEDRRTLWREAVCKNFKLTPGTFCSSTSHRPPAYPYLGTVIMGTDWPPKSALCVIVMGTKMVQNSGWSDIMWGREGTVGREV